MYKPIHMTQEWQREWKVLEKHLNILSWRECLTWMRVSVWGSPVLFDTDPSGLVMRGFFWKVYLYAPLLKPQHNSAVNPAPLYARGAHLTGVTEVACWILIPDSPFSISWECKQPLGDRFNHVFIFSNFPPLEDLSSPTLTTVLHLPFISKLLFSGSPRWPGARARPPRHSVTFRVFQKRCCLFIHRTKISRGPTQSLVWGSATQLMYYYIHSRTPIQICWSSEGIWIYKQWLSRKVN